MKKTQKFGIGTKVDKSGYKGVVIGITGSKGNGREVRLNSGVADVSVKDLKYWKKKK